MAEPKKKVRPGAIEIDPAESALLVNYEVVLEVVNDDGKRKVLERQKDVKKVKVKSLSEGTNVPLLAQEIVDKCKYIHHSKVSTVEELLYQLQQRVLGSGYNRRGYSGVADDEEVLRRAQQTAAAYGGSREPENYADINQLDTYLEALYEELPEKIKATAMIAQLGRHTELMEDLVTHETLLGALARVLREDGRKSIDLATNIISVFFSFSNFSQFHQVILENQVGDMTMRLIDLEVKRQDERERSLADKQAKGEKVSDDTQRKLHMANRKQEKLLCVCFYMLLNLAEDVTIERKMKKRNITVYLCKMLERRNVELLILAVMFLKKLSIYKENKDMMVECDIVVKLARFVPNNNEVLLLTVLRLLHNLSFDPSLRDGMVRCGLIPKVVELMKHDSFRQASMALLYHISMDDKCKSMFTYTDAIPIILDLLLRVEDLHTFPELIALAVNLTQNARNAEVICEGEGLQLLLGRALNHQDPLVFKVVRNLSQQEDNIKLKFRPYMEHLVDALHDTNMSNDLLVEILGTLGNLNIPQFDYTNLVRDHGLLDYLASHLQPGVVEDDIMLEVIILTGTLTNDVLADDIVNVGLVEKMYHLMSEKKEDDEFVLQISFTFHRFMLFQPTREALLHHTKVVYYLVNLLQDKNKELRKTADMALDVVMDTDDAGEWLEKVRQMKFEAHNAEWLEVIDSDDAEAQHIADRMYDKRGAIDDDGAEMGMSDDDQEYGISAYQEMPPQYADQYDQYAEQEYAEQDTQFWNGDELADVNPDYYGSNAEYESYVVDDEGAVVFDS